MGIMGIMDRTEDLTSSYGRNAHVPSGVRLDPEATFALVKALDNHTEALKADTASRDAHTKKLVELHEEIFGTPRPHPRPELSVIKGRGDFPDDLESYGDYDGPGGVS